MPRKRELVKVDKPTMTLQLGEDRKYDVYVLNNDNSLHLPYCRRDGMYFSGPGIVVVEKSRFGINVSEKYVNDEFFWMWIAEHMQTGLNVAMSKES